MSARISIFRQYLLFNIALLVTTFKSTQSTTYSNIVYIDEPNNTTFTFIENEIDRRFSINTEGCIIPNVNPNDMSVRRYLNAATKHARPCPNQGHRLLTDNRTHIMTVKEHFKYYGIRQESRLTCCYATFYRPRQTFGLPNKKVDDRITYSDCINFQDTIKVNNEFVRVNCTYKKKKIYKQFFLFSLKKPFTTYRANPFASERSMYNIIILGVSSVSRQNFYRTMPKTWNMLKNYEALELEGYSTIGVDTFHNLMPLLLGMNSSELVSACWLKPQNTLDSCPYIWERFKDVGYYTALAEDTARYGIFNKGKLGFRGSPTDYYIHPFIHESEPRIEPCKVKKKRHRRRYCKKSKTEEIPTCMGDKYYYEVLLRYIESLTETLKNTKLFGLFWESSISHDHFGFPQMMDDAYVGLLKSLGRFGYLESTIFIFMSDHGMDIGGVNLSKQGLIEQREPVFYIFAPPIFREEFKLAYSNLKLNIERLTTPFDVHQTLVDLLDLNGITDEEISKRSKEAYCNERGISLFLPIPGNRTCETAEVNRAWCNCYNYVPVTMHNRTKIAGVKQFLTKHLNEPLTPYTQCLQLAVKDIMEAYEMVPIYGRYSEWRDFKVIVSTTPGDGVYEAIPRFYKKNSRWILVNAMKRLNALSKNDCVDDDYVKQYCHCV